jgi:outer membrane protein
MKRVRLYAACLIVLSMIAIPYRAFALGLEAGVGYWKQTPTGSVSYSPNAAPGPNDTLDFKNDLNYESKNSAFVRVKAELPLILPNIYFMATPMSFEGDGKKNVQFTFGGTTFNANVPFQSKVKMDHYDLALYYTFLNMVSLGKINLDLGLNARMIKFEASVTQGATTESKSLSPVVPMVYAGLLIKPIKAFSIEGEARGIAMGANHYYDFIGRVKIKPIGPVYIAAGYRSEDVKIDINDVKSTLKVAGPFVEAGVSF